jgi:hypothetical protein
MIHNTADIAAYIVGPTERTPANDRTMGYFDSAIERNLPGLFILTTGCS